MKPEEKKRTSKCCNAEIDFSGGGYVGEDIAPIEEYCVKCGQILSINGLKRKIYNLETGQIIK